MNFRFYSPELRSKEWPAWHNADELVIVSRVALRCYNWIRWVGASIVPFSTIRFDYVSPLMIVFQLFSTLQLPQACACLILSQSIIQDWHVQPSTLPSRREVARKHFFTKLSPTDLHCLSSLPLAPHLPLWPGGDWMDCSTHGYSSVCKGGKDMIWRDFAYHHSVLPESCWYILMPSASLCYDSILLAYAFVFCLLSGTPRKKG